MKEKNNPQDTENRILQAAEKEFFEKGFAGARTTSIAEAAGVTHAMLHYYFRTKDNLFARVISEKMTMLGDIVLSAIGDSSLPLEERIRQGVERHFDFVSTNHYLPRFIVNELHTHPELISMMEEKVQHIVDNLLRSLQHEIDDYASRGLCQRVDARMLLIDIVSLNIFPFIASPLARAIAGETYEEHEEFLERRKRENVETILDKLQFRQP